MLSTLTAADFTRPEIYTAERDAVFRRSWLAIAHQSELPEGHALARTVAGWPLLLRREAGGALRGFFNVCRHRAGPLVEGDVARPCPTLRCAYHGWTYAADGRLRSAPELGEPLDPQAWALRPVVVDTWRGVIFAHLGQPEAPLAEALAPLAASAGALDLSGWDLHRRGVHTLECNWKVYVENYLEGYHIPWVHPDLNREVEMKDYQVEARLNHAVHRVPMRAGGSTSYTGFWAWLWPNAALNVYQGGGSLERITPLGPRRTQVEYTYVFAPDTPPTLREQGIESSRTVTLEDVAICEAVQRNLDSGVYTQGVLSPRHEQGVALFGALWRGAMA